jgi:cyclopropane fatty-acyl-phospholipid synthase-like methyltransferase
MLDLVWILSCIGDVRDHTILDAGAGWGLLQWALAERGASVISVDRNHRADPGEKVRRRYRVHGLRADDLESFSIHDAWARCRTEGAILASYRTVRQAARRLSRRLSPKAPGTVLFHRSDLIHLASLASESIDLVVSVSALEHNRMEDIGTVVDEVMRVLKPGGRLLATVAATNDTDFWHEPSRGWCLTEQTLRRVFHLPPESPSNFSEYDDRFAELVACRELRENLAQFYFESGENGMPWGVWDPQYHPVGILKAKPD